jgi:hypothetical protein
VTVLEIGDLCPKRISLTNRVEERRNGIYVRWQAKSKGISWMPPRPAPAPLYGKSSYIGRTPVAVVECKQKPVKKGGGPCGGRNKENQDFDLFVAVL